MFYFLTVITNLWTSLEFVLDMDGIIYIVWIFMHLVDQEYWFCSVHFCVVKKHISWSAFFLVWKSRLPGSRCVWLENRQCHICHVTAGVTMGRWCFGTPGLRPAYVIVIMGTNTFWKCWRHSSPVAAHSFTRTGLNIANPQVFSTCSYS